MREQNIKAKASIFKKVQSFNIDSIPPVKFVDIPKDIYESHPVRAAIMRVLREGITEGKTIRYALNAKEIRSELKKLEKIEISITNLYFHLNKLLNAEFISIIDTIQEKRHKIAYYGRTAQVVLFWDSEEVFRHKKRIISEFGKFLEAIQVNFNSEKIKQLLEYYYKQKQEREKKLSRLIFEYESIISREKLDAVDIYEVLKLLDIANPEALRIIKKIKENLPINLNQ